MRKTRAYGVKCRPPCKTCYGGAIITPSTREEEWEQEFDRKIYPITMDSDKVNMLKDFIRSLLTEERRLAHQEGYDFAREEMKVVLEIYPDVSGKEVARMFGLSLTNLSKDNI